MLIARNQKIERVDVATAKPDAAKPDAPKADAAKDSKMAPAKK